MPAMPARGTATLNAISEAFDDADLAIGAVAQSGERGLIAGLS